MEITNEMRIKLREPLPKEAIKQHPTKTFLSSIKAIYVIERLNDVFGVGSWQTKVNHIITTEKSMVVIKVEFSIPKYNIYYECYGGNDNGGLNSKNFDLGDAFKGASTDAITKIGSYLEIGIDVFKGKNTSLHSTATNDIDIQKKELLIIDTEKNYTKNWLNIINAIKTNKIISIEDIKKYYTFSNEVEIKILQILNEKNNAK